jgi:uncharacterized protein (DUF983 family)
MRNRLYNERPGVDAGWRVLFAFERAWPRATQAGRLGVSLMARCPHCGAPNEQGERICSACSLDLDGRSEYATARSGNSWHPVIIIWAIVIGAALLWWLIACIGASGLSDK